MSQMWCDVAAGASIGRCCGCVNRVLHLSQKPDNPSESCTIEMVSTKEYLGLGLGYFRSPRRNSMSGSREDRSKSPDPPVGNERNHRRTNNPVEERSHFPGSSSRRQTGSTSGFSNNVQPTAPGPSAIENSHAKSSSTSSSSRKSKEEKRSGPSDECEGEDEDSTGISLEGFEELSATEGKDQSFGTNMRRGSRKV